LLFLIVLIDNNLTQFKRKHLNYENVQYAAERYATFISLCILNIIAN